MPLDTFANVIDVNVNGAFWCARQAAREMIEQGDGGAIVNVTSIDALHPTSKGMSHYTTSKHALWGLTKCLALELGPEGIRTNAVAPGPSLTEGAIEYIQAGAPEGIDIEAMGEAAKRVPMRRWADPDEIARVAVSSRPTWPRTSTARRSSSTAATCSARSSRPLLRCHLSRLDSKEITVTQWQLQEAKQQLQPGCRAGPHRGPPGRYQAWKAEVAVVLDVADYRRLRGESDLPRVPDRAAVRRRRFADRA